MISIFSQLCWSDRFQAADTYCGPLTLPLCPGVVRVSLADMDRETRENYSVVIQAKDMGGQLGGLAGTTTVNITLSDINDNPPVFDQSKCRMSALQRFSHDASPPHSSSSRIIFL